MSRQMTTTSVLPEAHAATAATPAPIAVTGYSDKQKATATKILAETIQSIENIELWPVFLNSAIESVSDVFADRPGDPITLEQLSEVLNLEVCVMKQPC